MQRFTRHSSHWIAFLYGVLYRSYKIKNEIWSVKKLTEFIKRNYTRWQDQLHQQSGDTVE